MLKRHMRTIVVLWMVIIVTIPFAASGQTEKESKTITEISLDKSLPTDSDVIRDTLDNGIVYYIRKNPKPEDRAELRLVVNAGSILEDKNQQGLAHFVEHMAFNGTEHFEKQELVDYLESIGMRFGPEINAYTSFDETVYMLKVPTDSNEILQRGFLVLEDWAHGLAFDNEEIDKERGVVIEEWRLGRGANQRMRDEQFPILFKNSRYAERLPIGKKAVLDTFKHDTPKQFYRDWYRPDLMAVIAVGDFEIDRIQRLIHKHFAGIPPREKPRRREYYPVPGHKETYFAIASDKEATRSTVSIYYKMKADEAETIGEYRQRIVERLYNAMFNQRLNELAQQADAPFLYAYSGKGRYVRTSEFYVLNAMVKNNGIPRGMEALLTEAKRVRRHGFTESELERQKKAVLRRMESAYKERDKNESRRYASEYKRNFLYGEPFPGIEYEYKLYKRLLPGVKLSEVNGLAEKWITERNRVIMANSPEKENVNVPSKDELQAVLKNVEQKQVEPYVDTVSDEPLVKEEPNQGVIAKEEYIKALDVTRWTLENGVKVVLKPTDFKNDEILFSATSPGGYSLVETRNLVAAKTADGVIKQSGIAEFNEIELNKRLSDKVVSVRPYIDEITEGLKGRASPEDMETLFRLIYLYITEPRKDSTAFTSYKTRLEGYYQNRSASPEAAFRDSITAVITRHHPRFKPMDVEMLRKMDLQASLDIYRDRFADAGDFTFYFVGNFKFEQIKPLVMRYLGGLPATDRDENWSNKTYKYPEKQLEKIVHKGIEPKSYNALIFNGPFQWTPENKFKADMLVEVLSIKLRERIREELSGTYGVGVWGQFAHYPKERYRINIYFGCNPDRVDELTKAVFVQLDSIKQFGTTEKYLDKIKEIALRERESSLKKNKFWLNKLEYMDFHGIEPAAILNYEEKVNALTLKDIQEAANRYISDDRYVQVTLYPEEDAKQAHSEKTD